MDTTSEQFLSLQDGQLALPIMRMNDRDDTKLQPFPSHLAQRGTSSFNEQRCYKVISMPELSLHRVRQNRVMISFTPLLLPYVSDLVGIELSQLEVSCAPDGRLPRLHVHLAEEGSIVTLQLT